MTVENAAVSSAPTGQPNAGAGTTPAPAGATNQAAAGAPAADPTAPAAGDVSAPPKGEQGQAAKGNDTTPKATGALEVKVPDGVAVDQKFLDGFKTKLQDQLVAKSGLKPEQASQFGSELVAMYAEQRKAEQQALIQSVEKQQTEWMAGLSKEWGEKTPEKVAQAQAALLKFGGPDAIADIQKYGLGNLPSYVKAWAAVGAAIAEDSTSAKGAPPGGSGKAPTREEKWARVFDGKGSTLPAK